MFNPALLLVAGQPQVVVSLESRPKLSRLTRVNRGQSLCFHTSVIIHYFYAQLNEQAIPATLHPFSGFCGAVLPQFHVPGLAVGGLGQFLHEFDLTWILVCGNEFLAVRLQFRL